MTTAQRSGVSEAPSVRDQGPEERPARSWRTVAASAIGVTGELLITLGVLLGLFVAWQLWWTDVAADREQADVVAGLGWAGPIPLDGADDGGSGSPDPPPVMAEPAIGTTFATLRVPRWGEDYVRPISQGTSRRDVLDVLGLGHYEGTAMPGAVGNFAVAGHRTTYGKPLHRIAELEPGDTLVVQTVEAWYVYRVTESLIVDPERVEVVAPVPGGPGEAPTAALMTLTTCHPLYSASERYVVHAELDHWVPADRAARTSTGAA